MSLISLNGMSYSIGPYNIFNNADVQINENDKIAIIGRNGAGKTTLLKILSGMITADSGEIHKKADLKISILPQDIPSKDGTIYSIIKSNIENNIDDKDVSVKKLLSFFKLDGDLVYNSQSAGVKRRTLLVAAVAGEPDILLLDEPTNHLDINTINLIEDFFAKTKITLMFVTHDRFFLQKIATRIIEVDRGKIISWDCDYRSYLVRKENALEVEEKNAAKFDKKLAEEEAWLRKGVKARRTRNEGRVRALKKMREERSNRRDQVGNMSLRLQDAEKSGKMVIDVEDISFKYGENLIIGSFSTIVQRGDKIGLIGPNGAGKSTLIKLLVGELNPDSGSIKIGTNLKVAYFDQMRSQLDESKTLADNIANGSELIQIGDSKKHVVGYLQDFLFTPDRIKSKVEVLSGGEKNKLLLAKLFATPSNFLVLDEPTNDLDIESLEMLEDMLVEYDGTVLLVSHDRAFLDNVITSSFVFSGDGNIKEFIGDYNSITFENNTVGKSISKKERVKDKKVKLSFKERRELDEIPVKIDELESEQKKIYSIMSSPAIYQEDDSENLIVKYKERIEEIEKELEILYERWAQLDQVEN